MKSIDLKAAIAAAALICALHSPGASAQGALATPQPVAWIPTWYSAPEPAGTSAALAEDKTFRQVVQVSVGGRSLRLRLSNAYGTVPLKLQAIHLAKLIGGSRIDVSTDMRVTFNGHEGTQIAPGAYGLSDPLPLPVESGSELAISYYVSGSTPIATLHDTQRGALYATSGNQVSASEFAISSADSAQGGPLPWLEEIEVSGGAAKAAVVAFGDSITDGYGLKSESGRTWPQVLGQRFLAAGIPLSVVNAGISGNRLLHNGQYSHFGDASLARFDRDVLAQPNIAATIVLIGINDLGHATGPGAAEYVSAQDVIDGLCQLAERAHERGIKIYVGTLTPFKGTVFKDYYSPDKETLRTTINTFIRQTAQFDGVIDFDKAMRSPESPDQILPAYDLGDHLHPNEAGAAAMAASIPLTLFSWAKP